MLRSDMNTPAMEKKILTASKECFKYYPVDGNRIFTIFEHGHWWVRFYDNEEERDRTFSVCDAEGIGTFNGFDFEEI